MSRILRCHAEGRDDEWEAICLDLDIAVQGGSFEEVFHALDEAVSLYLESVSALPAGEQRHLLDRRAPLAVRLKFLIHVLRSTFRDRDTDSHWHQFTMLRAA